MSRTPIAVLLAFIGCWAGCSGGSSSGSDAGGTGSAATLKITSPSAGATIVYSETVTDFDAKFTVTGLTLKDAGSCAGAPACGHVQFFVDGTSCNDLSDPQNPHPWSAEASTSPVTIGLDYCSGFPVLAATHTLTAELHYDDEKPVLDAGGKVVSDQVQFKTQRMVDDGGASTYTVVVGQNGLTFSPGLLTIKAGDTVHWMWAASGHNVVSGSGGVADGKFCSPKDMDCANAKTSNMGDTYDHRFAAAGTFPYFCAPHFAAGMTGTIKVQ
jgi:plastocyanin